MLAIGSRQRCPYPELKGWFLFLVANAAIASRQRLVRFLTHPAVHPMYIQFLLGKDRWSIDTFDYFPRIDIDPWWLQNKGISSLVVDAGYALPVRLTVRYNLEEYATAATETPLH